jgi:orotidine-5'-phosphate decarboxylase
MKYQDIVNNIKTKKSFLCVGLDTDLKKVPDHVLKQDDPIFYFNQKIIEATAEFTVAYKPNLAFYEAHGVQGWQSLDKTVRYVKENHPDIFVIADAKRGDIGNTSGLYARAFFENMNFDAVTLAPYMGEDSISPFLQFKDKWAIVLALTSNKGAFDFQTIEDNNQKKVFEHVLETSKKWGSENNTMYVVGATKAEMLADIRKIIPNHFLLVPGVGAQGGSLDEVVKYGMNSNIGLLVNSSRGIIYANNSENFAKVAGDEARKLQIAMAKFL